MLVLITSIIKIIRPIKKLLNKQSVVEAQKLRESELFGFTGWLCQPHICQCEILDQLFLST